MKKYFLLHAILCLFLFLPNSPLHAQWAKTYGGSVEDVARSIRQTSDGGFIVAGFTSSFGAGNSDVWVLKLSSTGAIDWQNTYGGSNYDFARSIQQTNNGGYIVAGDSDSFGTGDSDIWVLRLSSTGAIDWQNTYGGRYDDYAYSIQQTSDGGFIVAGETYSFGAGNRDIWVLKLSSTGAIDWQNTYGGSNEDVALSIQQTSDGGFIVAGFTSSFGAGYIDIWVLKLSSTGAIDWQNTYGGSSYDFARSIQQTSDGGFIVAGDTESFGAGDRDVWVLKLSSTGAIDWQNTYGGSDYEDALSIQQTSDGGYITAGITSVGLDRDIWVLKLSSTGTINWQHTYGGSYFDKANFIQQKSDGGYIVAGYTYSFGAGYIDIWVLNLWSNGDVPSSCGFNGTSNALIEYTSVSPVNTNITPEDTFIMLSNPSCSLQSSNAIVTLLCPGYKLTISASTGGTTEPKPDTYTYEKGTDVIVTATPYSGYRFRGWTGNVDPGHENDNPVTINMDRNKLITANFIREYSLTISAGNGGTTNPSPGSYIHVNGTQVSITAVPDSGYQFSGWSGDATGTANPITINMSSNKSITANFQTKSTSDGGGGGICFIATAAYGSPLHPYVEILREFRERYLMSKKLGRKFVDLYYKYSPFIADLIAKHKPLRVIVQINLIPFVVFSYSMVHLGPVVTGGILLLIFMLQIFLISFLYKDRRSGS